MASISHYDNRRAWHDYHIRALQTVRIRSGIHFERVIAKMIAKGPTVVRDKVYRSSLPSPMPITWTHTLGKGDFGHVFHMCTFAFAQPLTIPPRNALDDYKLIETDNANIITFAPEWRTLDTVLCLRDKIHTFLSSQCSIMTSPPLLLLDYAHKHMTGIKRIETVHQEIAIMQILNVLFDVGVFSDVPYLYGYQETKSSQQEYHLFMECAHGTLKEVITKSIELPRETSFAFQMCLLFRILVNHAVLNRVATISNQDAYMRNILYTVSNPRHHCITFVLPSGTTYTVATLGIHLMHADWGMAGMLYGDSIPPPAIVPEGIQKSTRKCMKRNILPLLDSVDRVVKLAKKEMTKKKRSQEYQNKRIAELHTFLESAKDQPDPEMLKRGALFDFLLSIVQITQFTFPYAMYDVLATLQSANIMPFQCIYNWRLYALGYIASNLQEAYASIHIQNQLNRQTGLEPISINDTYTSYAVFELIETLFSPTFLKLIDATPESIFVPNTNSIRSHDIRDITSYPTIHDLGSIIFNHMSSIGS